MKRIMTLYTIMIISLLMNTAYAQWSIGILGGPNFADLEIVFNNETSTNHDIKSETMFGVGGFLGLSLNEYLSVRLEPMYLKKGGIFTEPSIPDISIESNQLELSLIFKVGIGKEIQPYILGGVSISFVLDASIETESAGLLLVGDLTEIIKRTEYGAVFGAGISIPVWEGSAFIEGRYVMGLSNLNKGGTVNLTYDNLVVAGPQTDPQDEIKTKGFQIMLGYQLPLGGG